MAASRSRFFTSQSLLFRNYNWVSFWLLKFAKISCFCWHFFCNEEHKKMYLHKKYVSSKCCWSLLNVYLCFLVSPTDPVVPSAACSFTEFFTYCKIRLSVSGCCWSLLQWISREFLLLLRFPFEITCMFADLGTEKLGETGISSSARQSCWFGLLADLFRRHNCLKLWFPCQSHWCFPSSFDIFQSRLRNTTIFWSKMLRFVSILWAFFSEVLSRSLCVCFGFVVHSDCNHAMSGFWLFKSLYVYSHCWWRWLAALSFVWMLLIYG